MRNSYKSGVSLIAVLLFMLAATTASIVVFKTISQENFSSGTRLKGSEAQQASQAGLEAVRGWLVNKGADVGAVLKIFEEDAQKPPVKLVSTVNGSEVNLLAATTTGFFSRNKKQNFEVYLTAAHTASQPYKLKFLSIGTARDGSKHSQAGIFEVEGLYKVVAYKPPPPGERPKVPAFEGGMAKNTQGKFESAYIHGDADVMGLSTSGDLIVAGSLTTQNNGQKRIGCEEGSDKRAGDMYVLNDLDIKDFVICGDAYIGGHLKADGSLLTFMESLYANGGITNSKNILIKKHLTLGGDYRLKNGNNNVNDDLVLESPPNGTGTLIVENESKITVGGNVWSMNLALFKEVAGNENNNDKHNNITLGGSGKGLYIYINTTPAPNKGKAVQCGNTESAYGCGSNTSRWYQKTYNKTDDAHFRTSGTRQTPTDGNKPEGAKQLGNMGSQIIDCPGKSNNGKCVKDPLTVPKKPGTNEPAWKDPALSLNKIVNTDRKTDLPDACIRLVKSPANSDCSAFNSEWGRTCNGDRGNFIKSANECYAALKQNDKYKILYPPEETDASKKFLPVAVKVGDQSRHDICFDGNFIFYFPNKMTQSMKFPPTKDNAKIFMYFEQGATGQIQWDNSTVGDCKKRNYFIFSEEDITGTSGSGTLHGAVLLANGAKLGGNMPDLTINFNQDLYEALVDMKIITAPSGSSSSSSGSSSASSIYDVYHIPSTSHLKVKLESQYANEETVGNKLARPSIMVLPRVIYLRPGEIGGNPNDLKNYYKVLYMNGAEKPGTEGTPSCSNCDFANGALCTCTLNSTSPTCSGSNLCINHPFYVVITESSLGDGGGVSSSSDAPPLGASSSSAAVTLICAGIANSNVEEGTGVSAPILTCSNTGTPPSGVQWMSDNGPFPNWGSSIPPGTYPNIRAMSATCGSVPNLTSTSCGSLTVTDNTSLTCNMGSIAVQAGSNIANAPIGLICSNNGSRSKVQYYNVGNQASLTAGKYSNVTVKADCGLVAGLTADCNGTLTVAELRCGSGNGGNLYAKAGGTISDHPSLSCITDVTTTVTGSFKDQDGNPWNWAVPSDAYGGFQYNDIKGEATCSGLSLEAECGTVTVAGITCSGLPSVVGVGGTIPKPTLICNNGYNATNDVSSYEINNSSSSTWPSGGPSTTTANQYYDIGGKANCSSNTNQTHLRNIPFTCPTRVAVSDADRCDYLPTMCDGMLFTQVQRGDSKNTTGFPNTGESGLCLFATDITEIGNNKAGKVIKVNGQVLPGKSQGSNPEGRCGGTGQSWQQTSQLSCAEALAGIPRMDGGYYIYIPQGEYGQNFTVTGGELNNTCSSTTFGCEYRQDWCGGKSYASVQHNSIDKPTDIGTCLFISDFTFGAIQPHLNSTISINGVENACGSTWGECPYSPKPPKADGGYYVYYEKGTVNRWQTAEGTNSGIVPGAVPTACDVSNTVQCNVNNLNSCYLSGGYALIDRPNLVCPENSGTPGQAEFYIYVPPPVNRDEPVANWNLSSWTHYRPSNAGENRRITLQSLYCGTEKKTFNPPIECGSINIRNTCSGISCNTNNLTCYKPGDAVPRPNAYCNGVPATGNAIFYYNTSNPASGWNSFGGTHPFTNTGSRPILLKSLTCSSGTINEDANCGSVTISNDCSATTTSSSSASSSSAASQPTVTSCTMGSVTIPSLSGDGSANNGYRYIISKPTITIVCSEGTATAQEFEANGSKLNWSASEGGTAHPFYTAGSKTVSLTAATCGGIAATGLPKTCGSFTVPSTTPATTVSCSFSTSSVTLGENIPAPTISCSSGTKDQTEATFAANPGQLPYNWQNWRTGSAAQYDNNQSSAVSVGHAITVSGVKCNNATVNGSTSCGTITVTGSGGNTCVSTYTFSSSTTTDWVKFCSGTITLKYSANSGCNIECYGATGFSPCNTTNTNNNSLKYINGLPGSQTSTATIDLQSGEVVTCNNVPEGLFCRTKLQGGSGWCW